jgi:hypothetical protein
MSNTVRGSRLYLYQDPAKVHPLPKKNVQTPDLGHVQGALTEQLSDIRFFALVKDRAAYYENIDLFGRQAADAFPSAGSDILDALRCMALELNTAAVFHLMRVAEFGLRALARDRGVVMTNTELRSNDDKR